MVSSVDKCVWPDVGDVVFSIDGSGAIIEHEWRTYSADWGRFLIGNYFRRQEEAEAAAERLKIRNTMEKLAAHPNGPDDVQEVFYIAFFPQTGIIDVVRCDAVLFGCPAFASKRQARAVINCVTEAKLRRYWFGEKAVQA